MGNLRIQQEVREYMERYNRFRPEDRFDIFTEIDTVPAGQQDSAGANPTQAEYRSLITTNQMLTTLDSGAGTVAMAAGGVGVKFTQENAAAKYKGVQPALQSTTKRNGFGIVDWTPAAQSRFEMLMRIDTIPTASAGACWFGGFRLTNAVNFTTDDDSVGAFIDYSTTAAWALKYEVANAGVAVVAAPSSFPAPATGVNYKVEIRIDAAYRPTLYVNERPACIGPALTSTALFKPYAWLLSGSTGTAGGIWTAYYLRCSRKY